jgi:hypothetical protein
MNEWCNLPTGWDLAIMSDSTLLREITARCQAVERPERSSDSQWITTTRPERFEDFCVAPTTSS